MSDTTSTPQDILRRYVMWYYDTSAPLLLLARDESDPQEGTVENLAVVDQPDEQAEAPPATTGGASPHHRRSGARH
jgi:hypothetical protein